MKVEKTETGSYVRTSVRLPLSSYDRLQRIKKKFGESINHQISEAVVTSDYLHKRDREARGLGRG